MWHLRVERLPVADAALQELRPVGDRRHGVGRLRQEFPELLALDSRLWALGSRATARGNAPCLHSYQSPLTNHHTSARRSAANHPGNRTEPSRTIPISGWFQSDHPRHLVVRAPRDHKMCPQTVPPGSIWGTLPRNHAPSWGMCSLDSGATVAGIAEALCIARRSRPKHVEACHHALTCFEALRATLRITARRGGWG